MSEFEAIRRLLAEYCQLCDDGQFDKWAGLFTSDGSFTAFGRTHTGRPALAEFIASAPLGKHLCFNAVIDLDGNKARCVSDFMFYKRNRELGSVGRYVDELVCEEEAWRFVSRSVEMMPRE
ncbi:nuclear transport factor 2 family protein [Myxococcota bacterium]|nr:nuclear transport factor 2 family protein [Myxococcota bacterium]